MRIVDFESIKCINCGWDFGVEIVTDMKCKACGKYWHPRQEYPYTRKSPEAEKL